MPVPLADVPMQVSLPSASQARLATFEPTCHGPGDFATVSRMIARDGLIAPTFGEALALVDAAHAEPSHALGEVVRSVMRERVLWTDTALLYLPGKGIFVVDHPPLRPLPANANADAPGAGIVLDQETLARRLKEGDPAVRFVAFPIEADEIAAGKLANNALVVGLMGEYATSLAPVVSRLATRFPRPALLNAFTQVESATTRVVALATNLEGNRLVIGCKCYDMGPNGNGMCGYGIRH